MLLPLLSLLLRLTVAVVISVHRCIFRCHPREGQVSKEPGTATPPLRVRSRSYHMRTHVCACERVIHLLCVVVVLGQFATQRVFSIDSTSDTINISNKSSLAVNVDETRSTASSMRSMFQMYSLMDKVWTHAAHGVSTSCCLLVLALAHPFLQL